MKISTYRYLFQKILLSIILTTLLTLSSYAQNPSIPEVRFRPYYEFNNIRWKCVDFLYIEFAITQGVLDSKPSDTLYTTDLLLVANDKPIYIKDMIFYDIENSIKYEFKNIKIKKNTKKILHINSIPIMLGGITMFYDTKLDQTKLTIYAANLSKK